MDHLAHRVLLVDEQEKCVGLDRALLGCTEYEELHGSSYLVWRVTDANSR